jgi:glycosyltransferase involved in cell wall biosynthesis
MTAVSVIVKALNEEANIAKAIESALRAIAGIGGEVILADALSSDRTVLIAQRFPITIVQLIDAADRGCGSGPQLGFQHARGEFIYLLDGDMELQPGFIETALPHFESESDLAGIGGLIEEAGSLDLEYSARQSRNNRDERPGYVTHLGCGGLYRAEALRQVGYFSNRNLHGYEELELGLRLGSAGWKLRRIDKYSIRHHHQRLGTYALLAKKWRGGFLLGGGELLRSAIGKSYLPHVLKELSYMFVAGCWMLVLLLALLVPMTLSLRLAVVIGLLTAPVIFMSIVKRNVRMGFYSVFAWCVALAGAIRGGFRSQVDPSKPIANQVLQRGEWLHPVSAGKPRGTDARQLR